MNNLPISTTGIMLYPFVSGHAANVIEISLFHRIAAHPLAILSDKMDTLILLNQIYGCY